MLIGLKWNSLDIECNFLYLADDIRIGCFNEQASGQDLSDFYMTAQTAIILETNLNCQFMFILTSML